MFLSSVNTGSANHIDNDSSIEINDFVSREVYQSPTYSVPEMEREYVIFAKDYAQYDILLDNLDVITEFDSLRAIGFNAYPGDKYLLDLTYPDQVFDAALFSEARIPEPVTIHSDSAIALDGNDEQIMNVEPLWDAGYNGTGVVVAVYDNGINENHPGLKDKVIDTYDATYYLGYSYAACKDHGTPVAGTIAGSGEDFSGNVNLDNRGMAFGAELVSVEMGCVGESGLWANFLGGFEWIVENNDTIKVVNTSWGGGGPSFDPIIRVLNSVNITLVGSAGNEGPGSFTTANGSPGNAISGISVGGIDYNQNMFSSSSTGPIPGLLYKPDVLAPAVQVVTTLLDGTYGEISGTSFSSPLTAGAVATLISAMDANDIPYNPGVIKAALMSGASSIGLNEMTQGQGIVDLNNTWSLILNADTDSKGMPMMLEVTPHNPSFISKYTLDVFQDITTTIPLTLITSHPDEVNVAFTGDFVSFASFDSSNLEAGVYSQPIEIELDTNGISEGSYSGQVIVSLGTSEVAVSFTVKVGDKAKAFMLMDLGHTNWDLQGQDGLAGPNTALTVSLAKDNGIWVEVYNDRITSSVLEDYDILWMPDALDLEDIDEIGSVNPLYDDEITAIVNWVDAGGSYLVDFNGLTEFESEITGGTIQAGLNASGINHLLSEFGISASTTPIVYPSAPGIASLYNFSSPSGSVNRITHFGNYLEVSGDAKAIGYDKAGISTAINDVIGGGRVLVTSTNFWMDSSGISGGYSVGDTNRQFADNMFKWFLEDEQIKFISSDIDGNTITGKYQALKDGSPFAHPEVQLLGNNLVNATTFTATDLGDGIYEFTYTAETDGFHRFQVVSGDNYAAWEFSVDTQGPVVETFAENPNFTGFPANQKAFIPFNVYDLISELSKTDITITLDGSTYDLLTYSYNPSELKLIVTIDGSLLGNTSLHWYILSITAIDESDNSNTFDYYFYVGAEQPEIPTVDESPISLLFFFVPLIAIPILRKIKK